MKFDKILAVFMVVFGVLGGILTCAAVWQPDKYGDFSYVSSDDGVHILEYMGSAENVEIPGEIDGQKVVRISYSAFQECRSLTGVIIPDGVTKIGEYAFKGCKNLTSVIIPDSVTEIGKYAFEGCQNLTIIDIPEGVEVIDSDTFNYCKKLTSVHIPKSLTKIGSSAFDHCDKLKDIYFGGNKSQLNKIEVKDNNWTLKNGGVIHCTDDEGNSVDISADQTDNNFEYDVLMNGTARITKYRGYAESVEIPSKICGKKVTELRGTVDYHITPYDCIIYSENFDYYSLFENCKKLKSVIIPAGVIKIDCGAFAGCEELESIDIPYGVKRIGEGAFRKCERLTSINIPDSVMIIEELAFGNCEELKDVYFSGSERQWNSIEIYYNEPLKNAVIHYSNLYEKVAQESKSENSVVTENNTDNSTNAIIVVIISVVVLVGIILAVIILKKKKNRGHKNEEA